MAKTQKDTGMMLFISYGVLFIVNSIVLLAANALFPNNVVLGTQFISKTWAVLHSMTALSFINTFAIPFVREYENKRGKMFTDLEWMVTYFGINLVAVWGIARFAESLGFGITSWMVAVVLAIAFDVVQGFAMMQLEKLRK